MISRPCPICGSEQRKELGMRFYELPAAPSPVPWELHDAVCLCCAFVYSWKVHPDDYIESFYKNTTTKLSLDHDNDARKALVNRYAYFGSKVLEYGAGASGLEKVMGSNYSVDRAEVGDPPPKEVYDLTAAYYVLEHVPDPRTFIMDMKKATMERGYIIVEVPDFTRHPSEALHGEHLNYFTEFHLQTLLETCGLAVVECVYGHSRGFGVAMVALVKPDMIVPAIENYKRIVK